MKRRRTGLEVESKGEKKQNGWKENGERRKGEEG